MFPLQWELNSYHQRDEDQKNPFLGKWKTADGRAYVEFLSGDVCLQGFLEAGHWQTTKYKFNIYHEGKDAMCGDSGMFSRENLDKIVFSHGMGGEDTTYYRETKK